MKIQLLLIAFLLFAIFSFASAQNINQSCPPLYTHSKIRIIKAEVTKIEVSDSNKFTVLPKSVLSSDSLSKLIRCPEIAARAGVTGDVIVGLEIDADGEVSKAKLLLGIGAGCDETALEVLKQTRFYPARINNEKTESEVKIYVNFYLKDYIDKPDIYFDEIEYEENLGDYHKIIRLRRSGEAIYYERIDKDNKTSNEGFISSELYGKLNDFIVSQCFLNFEDHYTNLYNSTKLYISTIIVTVKYNTNEKSVFSRENDNIPIGLWAITKLILYIANQMEWKNPMR